MDKIIYDISEICIVMNKYLSWDTTDNFSHETTFYKYDDIGKIIYYSKCKYKKIKEIQGIGDVYRVVGHILQDQKDDLNAISQFSEDCPLDFENNV